MTRLTSDQRQALKSCPDFTSQKKLDEAMLCADRASEKYIEATTRNYYEARTDLCLAQAAYLEEIGR